MDDVTVVIATYNRAHLISETLEGFINQSRKPKEIIVVDDGSTDDTPEKVKRFFPFVRYFRKENGGKSSALNIALPHATTDLVWIFDDDDVPYPHALELLRSTLLSSPSLSFTYGLYDKGVSGSDGRISLKERARVPSHVTAGLHVQRLYLYRYAYFMLSGCLIRRTSLLAAGSFDERLLRSQDYDMCIRLARAGNFSFCGESVYLLREHNGTRGPDILRHTVADRRKIWMQFDKVVGEKLLSASLLEFHELPGSSSFASIAEQRSALLRRAWVATSKGYVYRALDDLSHACELSSSFPLTVSDISILGSLADHPYFWPDLLGTKLWARTLYAAIAEPMGPLIMDQVTRSMHRSLNKYGHALSLRERAKLDIAILGLFAWARLRSLSWTGRPRSAINSVSR